MTQPPKFAAPIAAAVAAAPVFVPRAPIAVRRRGFANIEKTV